MGDLGELSPLITGSLYNGARLIFNDRVIASYGEIISGCHKWTRQKLRHCLEPVMCLTSQALCNTGFYIDPAILTNFANRVAFLILLEEGVFLMCSKFDGERLIRASQTIFEQCRSHKLNDNFIRAVQTITAISTNTSICCLRAESHMKTLTEVFNN